MWSLFEIRRICCVWKPSFDLFWICLFVSQWRRTDWLVQPLNEWTTSTAFAYIFSTRFFWYESIAILLMLLLSLTFSFSSSLSLPIPLSLSLSVFVSVSFYFSVALLISPVASNFSNSINFFRSIEIIHTIWEFESIAWKVYMCAYNFSWFWFLSHVFFSNNLSYWANSMFGCVISVDQNNFVAFCILIIEIEIMVCFDK